MLTVVILYHMVIVVTHCDVAIVVVCCVDGDQGGSERRDGSEVSLQRGKGERGGREDGGVVHLATGN